MNNLAASTPASQRGGYFPLIVCLVCDSPIDALVALCLPRVDAEMLVAAARHGESTECILATLSGGRPIAAVRTPEGRWAACNAFPEELFGTPEEADRKLARLLRPGRTGYVGRCSPPQEVA